MIDRPKRVLVLGSGALQIGQAGEFDYSGSQALKALKEEGIHTVLVNPNIATVQTDPGRADRVYLVALTVENVTQILEREKIDALLLSFGGQTALNLGLALDAQGVLKRLGVRVLGTPIAAIRDSEDRAAFVRRLDEISIKAALSRACTSVDAGVAAARTIGFPVMLRAGFSLGGQGSGIVDDVPQLKTALTRAFKGGVTQVLVEECLRGWKEIEYEVVRDRFDNCVTVCNMENMDPMGIHTGESIVVAPSQTLDDSEYQMLRAIAIKVVRHLGIVGECNIQYALDPHSREYRVIEVNARLSRSSALASKATGYPLAYIAAKLALGHALSDLPNAVTGSTSAFFEPSLDYIVCKVPRWDLAKFRGARVELGSEMKSVGEVMAIGRSFPEALQKALRMLDVGVEGLDPAAWRGENLEQDLKQATPARPFAIARALADGMPVDKIHALTQIDPWFLNALQPAVALRQKLAHWPIAADDLRNAKELGYGDKQIAKLCSVEPDKVRIERTRLGIVPHFAQVDTLAAEFPAETNYVYTSYRARHDDIPPKAGKKIVVLGSGPYRIGSSVEFDWCCVKAAEVARQLGFQTIMINCNPETVSTDYDTCDMLLFDEISVESVIALCEREKPLGVVVSMGGQLPNRLALPLARAGIPLLGTSAASIDTAEDRKKFSALLDSLQINQPKWAHITDRTEVEATVARLGGFPVLVRPSYVLSGAAMTVAHEPRELERILERASNVSPEHPVVVSKFELRAREVEVDAIASAGEVVLSCVTEHVEDAGVHSGDATLMLPPQSLSMPTLKQVRTITEQLAKALAITGPFNVQFLAKNNQVKVIECNLRASRSLPFVAKATGRDFVGEAVRAMVGAPLTCKAVPLELDYVAVKAPKFSFSRLHGADPLLGVEMASTGEVGCLGSTLHEALLQALLATGVKPPSRGVLVSLGPVSEKYAFLEEARILTEELKIPLYATEGTAAALRAVGIPSILVGKAPEDAGLSMMQVIGEGRVDLVVNVPRSYDASGRPDGYWIRRAAIDHQIPLITDLRLARALVEAVNWTREHPTVLRARDEFAIP